MTLIANLGSAALARSAYVLGDIPLPLQESGGFRMWVLERPIPTVVVLVAAAAIFWFVMRRQGKEKDGTRGALVLLALAVATFATGTFIETEAEKLKARTREIVAATAKADVTAVSGMLTQDAYASPFGLSREQMLNRMEATLGRQFTIKEHRISSLRASVESDTRARTQFQVHAVSESLMYNLPVGSWWMVSWRKDGGGDWKASQIEMQQFDLGEPGTLRP